MRLVFYSDSVYVKKSNSIYYKLDDLVQGSNLENLELSSATIYDHWANIQPLLSNININNYKSVEIRSDVKFDPVSIFPKQVFAIGTNYIDHAKEMRLPIPKSPVVFTKFQSCITGANASISLPSKTVDYENELTVVIGKRCRNVAVSDALEYVAGVTVGQDLSERTLQFANGNHFSLGKSFPRFAPIGPELVTLDEIDSVNNLKIKTRLNGKILQDSSTSQMIFNVNELISYLSSILQLFPGDLIFTGTPVGVGYSRSPAIYLKPNDVLVSEIENVTSQTIYFK
jgi:2-keto-4-pentenoate hydratase/2-oxohepta-3-ene-1,7-dioic acid hydratase in catechol pathway